MIIQATSDLHGFLPEINKSSDIFLICGDIIPLDYQMSMKLSKEWLEEEFTEWASSIPSEKVILIAGNHDFWFERYNSQAHDLFKNEGKITYLKNESYEFISSRTGESVKIFGTPYCKIFGNWAFMREPEKLQNKFLEMPNDIDILMTHDAPYGTSDICLEDIWWNKKEHIGNPQLQEAIILRRPKVNLHGHLHSTSHSPEFLGETKVINVSYVNEKYDPQWEPLILDYSS